MASGGNGAGDQLPATRPIKLSQPVESFRLNFDFRPNAPAFPVDFAVPTVPAGLPACDGVKIKSNLTVTVTVTGPNSSDTAQICVGQ